PFRRRQRPWEDPGTPTFRIQSCLACDLFQKDDGTLPESGSIRVGLFAKRAAIRFPRQDRWLFETGWSIEIVARSRPRGRHFSNDRSRHDICYLSKKRLLTQASGSTRVMHPNCLRWTRSRGEGNECAPKCRSGPVTIHVRLIMAKLTLAAFEHGFTVGVATNACIPTSFCFRFASRNSSRP